MSSTHVRPNKRTIPNRKPKPIDNVEETRVKMESWMGLGTSNKTKKEVSSILKTPKYSGTTLVSEPQPVETNQVLPEATGKPKSRPIVCKNMVVERDPTLPRRRRKRGTSKFAQSTAVEGYVPTATATPSRRDAHTPSTAATTTPSPSNESPSKETSISDPLILNSIEELFQAAGTPLPETTDRLDKAQLIEADLSFSVMTQD